MQISHPVPVEILHQLLRLDQETGKVYWRKRGPEWFRDTPGRAAAHACAIWNARWAGKEAFTAHGTHGYDTGTLLGRNYLKHRVIFAMANGGWPANQVDHWDVEPGNNQPGNLRDATRRQNAGNRSAVGGTSALKGVSWDAHKKRWRARCADRTVGYFREEVDAARAYDAAARDTFGAFARLNFPLGES